jgi:hypothetical protein
LLNLFWKFFQNRFFEQNLRILWTFFLKKSNFWNKISRLLGKCSEKYFFWKKLEIFWNFLRKKSSYEKSLKMCWNFFEIYEVETNSESFVKCSWKNVFLKKMWLFFYNFFEIFCGKIFETFLKFHLKSFFEESFLKTFWNFLEKIFLKNHFWIFS